MLSAALRHFAVRLAVTTLLSFFQHPGAARAVTPDTGDSGAFASPAAGDHACFYSPRPHVTGTIKVE
jgi:hypothetical protein